MDFVVGRISVPPRDIHPTIALEQIADPASTSSQSSEFIAAMSNNLTQFFGAFVADALQLCGVGLSNFGGTVAGHALQQLIRKRLDDARDIVLEEIQRGDRLPIEPADGDEVVAIVFKYLTAAREGTARRNLRLMARIMRGQAATRSLYADEFSRFASVIASLTYEEVCTVATTYRIRKALLPKGSGQPIHNMRNMLDQEISNRLVGKDCLFRQKEDLEATRAALQRTGLIYLAGTGSSGNAVYAEAPLLDQLGDLAKLEDPLPEEAERPLQR
jgi:hypothetical protein